MGLAIYQKLQNLTMNQRGEVIDLECPLNGNIGIEAQISVNRPNGDYGDYYAFGARDVESGHAIMGASQLYRYGTYQTTFFYGTSATYWSYATPVNLMTYRIIVPASGSVTLQGSSSRTVSRQSFSYPDHNLYIFGVHVKDGDKDYVEHNNTGYIMYVKVTNKGTLIRDMVPVKRLSDGICGLLDKVSKKFFITKSGNTSCLSGTVVANVYYDAQGNEMSSMESLVEKLNYTNETKGLIKSALQNKGIEVSDTDSFRSYVDKINSIQSGGGINNSDTMGEYIIKLDGEPTNITIEDYIKTVPLLDTSNLTSMNGMFSGCSSIETIPLLDTSNVTNMNRMFASCSKLTDFPILDTSNVTNVTSMFEGCKSLNTIDISKYNLQSTSSLDSMFKDCTSLTHVSLSNCNISHITNFKNLFNGCTHMTSIELTNVNLSNATQLTSMFTNCSSLTSIDFSKCGDMLKVSDLGSMLYGCSKLIDLNISNIDMGLITSINSFFGPESSGSLSCRSLENLQFGTNLGKGYTEQADNYRYYPLIIKHSTKLTHESLMNVINNVYDLNLTYDVANGGTLYTQKLNLGTTNVAKLTAEEIAIATNKGWTVS